MHLGTPYNTAVASYFPKAGKRQLDRVVTGLRNLKGRKQDGKEPREAMELGGKYELESRGAPSGAQLKNSKHHDLTASTNYVVLCCFKGDDGFVHLLI